MFIYLKKRSGLHKPRKVFIYNITIRTKVTRDIQKLGSITLQPYRVINLDIRYLIRLLIRGFKFSSRLNELFFQHTGSIPSGAKKIIKGYFK